MKKHSDLKDDVIIDLDAEHVIEHEVPQAAKPVPPAKAKASKRGWLLGAVGLLAAAVAGGWLYKDVLSVYLPSDQVIGLTERLAVIETQNSTLQTQVSSLDKLATQLAGDMDALEAKSATLAGLAEDTQRSQGNTAQKLMALDQALAEIKRSVDELASRPAPVAGAAGTTIAAPELSALQQRIATLEKDVASLKVKPAEVVDSTVALSQTLSDLKAKIASGVGYRDELERIQRMVPAASGLDFLQQHATLGIPDAKGLSAELKKLIPQLPKPIIPGPLPESEGWWAGIYSSLSDLITIKVEGDVDWPTAASAAAAFADSGDLPQAIDHLATIEGAKPAEIQQWLDHVNARLAADKAVQSVEEAVLRVIASKG
jgi:hypothetical protein